MLLQDQLGKVFVLRSDEIEEHKFRKSDFGDYWESIKEIRRYIYNSGGIADLLV